MSGAHRATCDDSSAFPSNDVTDYLGLYRLALSASNHATGYYNRNVRAAHGAGSVLIRIPIADADEMDLRVMRESDILHAVTGRVDGVPSLIWSSTEPPFQVHEYVEGRVVDKVWPRGVRLPRQIVPAVMRLLRQLRLVPRQALPPIDRAWPTDGSTVAFGRLLSEATERVYERFRERFRWALAAFSVPPDPLRIVHQRWLGLTSRPFCLVHSDVHRKNIILTPTDVVFIDWELSLWGDPLYDLAVHISKMSYLPDEQERLLRMWRRAMPPEVTAGWAEDLPAYLLHERVKAALVNTFRYLQLFEKGGLTAAEREQLIVKLTTKVGTAHVAWYGTDAGAPDRDTVGAVLVRAAELRGRGRVSRTEG